MLSIYRQHDEVTDLNIDDIDQAHADKLASELDALEGWSGVLNHVSDNFAIDSIARFNTLIEEDRYRTGTGPGGEYTFTADEISRMKATFSKYVQLLEKELLAAQTAALFKVTKISDTAAGYQFLAYLKTEATKILTSVQGAYNVEVEFPGTDGGDPVPEILELPVFKYSTDSRFMAATFLASARGEASDWGINEKSEVRASLKAMLSESLGGRSIESLPPVGLPGPLAKWIIDNNNVLSGFVTPISLLGL